MKYLQLPQVFLLYQGLSALGFWLLAYLDALLVSRNFFEKADSIRKILLTSTSKPR